MFTLLTVKKSWQAIWKFTYKNETTVRFMRTEQREFDTMRLPTKQLISKIETLSNDLSQEQLSNFLDIINAMTALVEEASELSKTQDIDAPATISNSLVH